jgi:DNA-binding MarR family transcriptional regulator
MHSGGTGLTPPIDQFWIDRYRAARPQYGARKAGALSPIQRDVLRAWSTYEPRPSEPAEPPLAAIAEIASCRIGTVARALEKAKELGLLEKSPGNDV